MRHALCTDLDRTLLPNGSAEESPAARICFRELAAHPRVLLVYVSGRDKGRVQEAMDEYFLPVPDFVIADVGSSIYAMTPKPWLLLQGWRKHLRKDWQDYDACRLRQAIGHIGYLALQDDSKQGEYKLSYDVTPALHLDAVCDRLTGKLNELTLPVNIIVSIDETTDTGLIDLLPPSANKRLALEWLMARQNIRPGHVVFSGDSGNDSEVLLSPYKATLVANAEAEFRQRLLQAAASGCGTDSLYVAGGLAHAGPHQAAPDLAAPESSRDRCWPGPAMNGNYAAGIVEGFLHYFPEFTDWILKDYHHV
jgi:HAD superfamily hydrolase (TIGR01484 family)